MLERRRNARVIRAVLGEPTFHFLVLAGGLFAVNAAFAAGRGKTVELHRGEVAARITQIEASTGSPLTPAERSRVQRAFVEEQVLVREALELGLDRDSRIHDLLAQKMLHVLSADVIQPEEDELRAFYRNNVDLYTPPPTVTVEEVVFPPGTLTSEGRERLSAGEPPASLSEVAPIAHGVLADVTRDDLARIMDTVLADRVFEAKNGSWVGSAETVRGLHWYRVTDRAPSSAPVYSAIRERVRLDWIASEEEALLDRRVRELASEYTVVWVGEERTASP